MLALTQSASANIPPTSKVKSQDPCPQWQAAEASARIAGALEGWRCARADSPDEGNLLAYRVTVSGEPSSERWIDAGLRFPLRVAAADGSTITLEHLRTETLEPAVFTVPAGYRRLDPQALLNRIKHSDVWVEPPTAGSHPDSGQ